MKIRFLILLLATIVSALPQADPPRVNGTPVVKTNDGPHYVTATGSSAIRSTKDRFSEIVNVLDYGAAGTGSALDSTAIQAAFNAAASTSKREVIFPSGTYVADALFATNLNIRLMQGAKLIHNTNGAGHLLTIKNGGTLTGGTLDGNTGNQTGGVARYSTLHVDYLTAQDVLIESVTFTNYFYGISGSSRNLKVFHSKFRNGAEHSGILGLDCSAANFLNPVADSTNNIEVAFNLIEQDDLPSDFGTTNSSAPGGFFFAGGQTNNAENAWINPNVHNNIIKRVGQTKSGNHRGGIHFYSGICSGKAINNELVDCLYIPIDIQNSGSLTIDGNLVTSKIGDDGTGAQMAIVINPNVRTDTDRHSRYTVVRNNIIIGYVGKTGIYAVSSNAKGFELRISGNTITNCGSGIGVYNWEGPIGLDFNRVWQDGSASGTPGAGIYVDEVDGEITYVGNAVYATNTTGILLLGTNTTHVWISGEAEARGSGWTALTVRGVKSFTGQTGRFRGLNSATAVTLLASGSENIQSVNWDFFRMIIESGSFGYTASAITKWRGFIVGSGTPEGVISADAGDAFYYRTDSGNRDLYYKESGTGTTAWRRFAKDQVTALTTSATLTSGENYIRCDSTAGAMTVTLPLVGTNLPAGQVYSIFKNSADANVITIAGNGLNINGSASITITNRYQGVILRYDNLVWQIVARFPEITQAHVHPISEVTGLQAELDNKQPLDSDLTTIANNNPGNSYYFGTDAGGTKGFHTFPTPTTITNYATFALSDLTTALTAAENKNYWRPPYAIRIVSIKASVLTASSSGAISIDVEEGGTTIFSTPLTIDASETDSSTAASAAVISDTDIAANALLTFDLDSEGTNAAGLQVTFAFIRI